MLGDSMKRIFINLTLLSHNDIEYPISVEQKRQGSSSYYLINVDSTIVDCQGRISGDQLDTCKH